MSVLSTTQPCTGESLTTIGGTFDALHTGHKAYIRRAFDYAEQVLIYIASDLLAQKLKNYKSLPYELRKKRVLTYLKELCVQDRATICKLDECDQLKYDFVDNQSLAHRLSMAIIGPEYYDYFREINARRLERGLAPVDLVVKERIRNGDNMDLSSSAIRNGQVEDAVDCYDDIAQAKSKVQLDADQTVLSSSAIKNGASSLKPH